MYRYLLAVTLAAAAATPAAADDCALRRVASLPMTIDVGGGIDVPMTIAGRPVTMLVNTGAVVSMLDERVVRELQLSIRSMSLNVTVNGTTVDRLAVGHNVELGNLKGDLSFAMVPSGVLSPGRDGTLAPDLLRAYDADFDFAGAKFNLFSQDHCRGKVVYWTKDPVAPIAMTVNDYGHILVPIQIDGKEAHAQLDTSASRSYMSLHAAESLFGFDDSSADLEALNGGSRKYPFKTLSFEGVTVGNPDIVLIPKDISRLSNVSGTTVILGMGILRRLHLYIAYKEKMLYVTPASAL